MIRLDVRDIFPWFEGIVYHKEGLTWRQSHHRTGRVYCTATNLWTSTLYGALSLVTHSHDCAVRWVVHKCERYTIVMPMSP